ncbi:MAG: site-specific DNA-methyltransferase [Candidatus Cryptobacteroides sp.]
MAQDKINKLELTWIGKYDEKKGVESRILIENKDYSYGEPEIGVLPNGKPWNGNMLIHGDNLLALKALEQNYTNSVKCIYIDPPYNTGNAFDLYDDMVEHSIWLSLMFQRFQILHALLRKDGFIFVNLDEQEHAYAKVILDGIFGRNNFIGDIIWQKRKGGGNDSRFLALDHDYILVYAKDSSKSVHQSKWTISQSEEYLKRYKEIDENGNRFYWDTVARNGLQSPIPISVKCPDGTILSINSQMGQETINEGLKNGDVRLTKSKNGWTLHHRVYMSEGQRPRSIFNDSGTNKSAADEMLYLFGSKKSFPYPKPELLIQKILELGSNPGDLVLDSFLGSGTTAAVAQKMGRRYIGIELGDHAYTHCVPRLKMVTDGSDQGGISKAQNWKGGSGFKFYELAPSLLKEDKYGHLVINKEYNADMLAAAMAKQEGFTYSPSEDTYWKQGYSSESDYIYTTTQFMTVEMLAAIAEQMADGESLLICCTAFQKECKSAFSNITIKKIPQILLGRCEFNHDDYSLNVIELPQVEDDEIEDEEEQNEPPTTLFD